MTAPFDAARPYFDAARPYRLSPSVALRPEPFGALAYHFGNRRLSFLKAPGLVELVRNLDRYPTAGDALAGVPVTGATSSSARSARWQRPT
ncbi:mycofactocin biosynthesis chaperone MftB [Actinomadura madurae]|uniref:mycofactocin biosynthesis chaperone MftB n=1 Tax=Actinomadura madurae TaxID=1993 RepID=UPI000D8AC56A|nr:mycofactocin biosynthesis chaperone MftB [Actinomadura madurae]SPT49915.1 putative mycofactocin binding protein MftB [Actinomadura madurae]